MRAESHDGQAHVGQLHAVPGPSGAGLINFGEAVSFPLLFGVALSLFGAATLVHLLLVSVSRRRAEAGLLKVCPSCGPPGPTPPTCSARNSRRHIGSLAIPRQNAPGNCHTPALPQNTPPQGMAACGYAKR